MKWLCIAVLCFAAVSAADKSYMLSENRIAPPIIGTTCEECTHIVDKARAALHDPAKLAELKALLGVLCHETSYVEECRMFVSKLDVIIAKLEPYIKDSHVVCKKLRMCENTKLAAFYKLGLLYVKQAESEVEKDASLKDLICDECQLAASELKKIVSDKEKQREVREFISTRICKNVGQMQGMCDMIVEQFLPEIFEELDALLVDAKKACSDVGFCATQGPRRKLERPQTVNGVHPVIDYWQKLGTLQTKHGQVLMSCLECKVEWDGILEEMINNRQGIANDLQGIVCEGILPANFSLSCDDFMSMYLPTVVYMTVLQFTSQGICKRMHSCDAVSWNNVALMQQDEINEHFCDTCQKVGHYVQNSFVGSAIHFEMEREWIEESCSRVPKTIVPLCERYISGLVNRFAHKGQQVAKSGLWCKNLHC